MFLIPARLINLDFYITPKKTRLPLRRSTKSVINAGILAMESNKNRTKGKRFECKGSSWHILAVPGAGGGGSRGSWELDEHWGSSGQGFASPSLSPSQIPSHPILLLLVLGSRAGASPEWTDAMDFPVPRIPWDHWNSPGASMELDVATGVRSREGTKLLARRGHKLLQPFPGFVPLEMEASRA